MSDQKKSAQTLFDLDEDKKKDKTKTKKKTGFSEIGSILEKYNLEDRGGYITQEFQDYGYRLAVELNDMSHKSLYIKMAKTINRGILERALSFVTDADSAKSKARLFMWKIKQLKEEKKNEN